MDRDKALMRLVECLKNKHEIEFIVYQREGDYGDRCPPIEVVHCDSCGDEIAVTPLNPKDHKRVKEYFCPSTPILNSEELEELNKCYKSYREPKNGKCPICGRRFEVVAYARNYHIIGCPDHREFDEVIDH
jgi:hypothetical protein